MNCWASAVEHKKLNIICRQLFSISYWASTVEIQLLSIRRISCWASAVEHQLLSISCWASADLIYMAALCSCPWTSAGGGDGVSQEEDDDVALFLFWLRLLTFKLTLNNFTNWIIAYLKPCRKVVKFKWFFLWRILISFRVLRKRPVKMSKKRLN